MRANEVRLSTINCDKGKSYTQYCIYIIIYFKLTSQNTFLTTNRLFFFLTKQNLQPTNLPWLMCVALSERQKIRNIVYFVNENVILKSHQRRNQSVFPSARQIVCVCQCIECMQNQKVSQSTAVLCCFDAKA